MRKKLAAVLTMGLILGTSGSVYAANLESSETQFTCTVTNEPSYTVSIPSSVTMAADGTDVDITVTDVNNLQDGQKVSVTVAGTDFSFDQLVLSGRDSGGINRILGYKIQRPDGTFIESIANVSVAKGQEIVSFTEDGTKTYRAIPEIGPTTVKGVTYTGSLTYGIAVADAE